MLERQPEHDSPAGIRSINPKIGYTAETLWRWMRQRSVIAGYAPWA